MLKVIYTEYAFPLQSMSTYVYIVNRYLTAMDPPFIAI